MTKNSTVLLNMVLLSSLGLGVGCINQPKTKNNALSTNVAAQLAGQGKVEEAAQVYSRIGEILLSRPEGIMHSETMFQKALELNVHDNKANLYSAILSPLLTAKGFVPRFMKHPNQGPNELARAKKLEKSILASEMKEFIDFALVMPEGKKAAKTNEDVRKFIRNEYTKELGNSLNKLENIKSERFLLDLDVSAYQDKTKTAYTYCHQSIESGYVCEESIISSGGNSRVRVNVDSYDLKALKILLKAQKSALTILYSIGLEGSEEYDVKRSKMPTNATDKDIVDAIKSQPNFLRLTGNKDDLREIFTHTEDVMNDLIDFSRISKEICGAENRKTNIANNICVSEAAAEKIGEILMFVVGPKSVVLGHDRDGEEVSVEVNLRGLLDSKVTSLQELLPNKFDSNGKAIDLADPTFAGIIPNGDLISKLKTIVK